MSIYLTYIINVFLLVCLSYWGYRSCNNSALKVHYWPGLLLKLLFGVLLGLLFYSYYGSGDTIMYYAKASSLVDQGWTELFQNVLEPIPNDQSVRAIYFIRFVAVIKFITGADYWLLSAYFSLFSFFGSYYFAQKLSHWKPDFEYPVVIAFLYFPSVVFWSSGLLKESLVFGAFNILLGYYLSFRVKKRIPIQHMIIGIFSMVIIGSLKYYIAAIAFPLICLLMIHHVVPWNILHIRSDLIKSLTSGITILIPALIFLHWLHPNLALDQLWAVMKKNHNIYIELNPEGAIYPLEWFNEFFGVIINIPYLWFSGLFRPIIGEYLNFPAVLSSLENFILLIGAILALYGFSKNKVVWQIEWLTIIVYASILSVFLSYATPNFGTLARFKVYYMPYVVLLIAFQVQSLSLFRKN